MVDQLVAAAPFASWGDKFKAAGKNDLISVAALPWQNKINVRGNPQDRTFVTAINRHLNISLPLTPNTWTAGEGTNIGMWLAPDEWLIISDDDRAFAELAKTLANQDKTGDNFSLVDVSDNYVGLSLSLSGSRSVLSRALTIDVGAMNPGECVGTNFADAAILLLCLDDKPTFNIYVRPSFADYLSEYLLLCCASVKG